MSHSSDPASSPPDRAVAVVPMSRAFWQRNWLAAFSGGVVVGALLLFKLATTRDSWISQWFPRPAISAAKPETLDEIAAPSEKILLSEQAQRNLRLTAKPLVISTYPRTISIPGMVIDRPGVSDRGIVSPVTGIITRIHRIAGETVRPGDVLFTLKLLSESLHLTQTDLFKSTQDIKLARRQRERLLSSTGAVPESRIIEVDNQITRLEVASKAYRQELLNRGLSPEQIESASEGKFVNEIPILVPNRSIAPASGDMPQPQQPDASRGVYEIEGLKVELGQQVLAGQTLCRLASHEYLTIEGRAFLDELPLLERALESGWGVTVDLEEEQTGSWGKFQQRVPIRYLSNTIDPETRTFPFQLPLNNQTKIVERDGHQHVLWRFRPGQRLRLSIQVEELTDIFVLPVEAVAWDGAEAYVFRQNGDEFDRKPVHVVYQDRTKVIIKNDGSIAPGVYVAQTGAFQLNRMIKSQTGSPPKGYHIHPDGSIHMGSH